MAVNLFDSWSNAIETEVRARARQFMEELIRVELDTARARHTNRRLQLPPGRSEGDVAQHKTTGKPRGKRCH